MDQNEANSINSDLIRGHIDTIILKALQAGDRYGYDIIKEIEQKSGGQYIIKQPTLYSCLKRLEVQGFVKSYWGSKSIGGRKKYFTLTDLGRQLFIRNKNDWDYSRDIINRLISDDDYLTAYEDEEITEPAEEELLEPQPVENDEEELLEPQPVEDDEEELLEPQPVENDEEELLEPQPVEAAEEELLEPQPVEDDDEEELLEPQPVEDDEDELLEPQPVEDEPLPLSAAEQEYVREDYEAPQEPNPEQLIDRFYSEQSRESYLTNADNAQYEPPHEDEIDASNYFADLPEEDYEDEEEVASSVEYSEPQTDDAVFLPPPDEDMPTRRIVRENQPENNTVFFSYKQSVPDIDNKAFIIDKEYRDVIAKMINSNVVNTEPKKQVAQSDIDYAHAQYFRQERQTPPEPEPQYYNPSIREADTQAITQRISSDTGENITVRTHSNKTLRSYNNKHYYYCNQLRLLQNGLLFGIMLLEIVICFYCIEVVHNKMAITKLNLALYIVAVVLAAILPISAFFSASSDYYKRKRINYSGKSSAIFSVAATILLALIVFFANVYGGILSTSNLNNYLTSLIMPIVLSTNVIINAIIFHFLYNSGKYNVEE